MENTRRSCYNADRVRDGDRFKEFKNPALTITNTVECSAREMVKQMRVFNFGLGIALFKYEGTSPRHPGLVEKIC